MKKLQTGSIYYFFIIPSHIMVFTASRFRTWFIFWFIYRQSLSSEISISFQDIIANLRRRTGFQYESERSFTGQPNRVYLHDLRNQFCDGFWLFARDTPQS